MSNALDYNVPPLAPMGKGIYRLRNGSEEMIAANTDTDEYDLWPWRIYGHEDLYQSDGAFNDDGSRHPRDIVALVSLAPTRPGVYELACGSRREMRCTVGRWQDQHGRPCDEWGRMLALDAETVLGPLNHLVRRIGDLPAEPKAAPTIAVQHDRPSYTPEEAAAAMAALCPELTGKDVFAELIAAIRTAAPTGRGVVISPQESRVLLDWIDSGAVEVRRDDLLGMHELARQSAADAFGYPSEDEYRSLHRVAAALGVDLPSWLTNHAREQGWDGGAECD